MNAPAKRVLIVDDDVLVGQVISSYLRRLGYAPTQTAKPAAALKMLSEYREVAFVVCDVVMPGMNGPELVSTAAERVPGLRVLFVSGYDMEELREEEIPGVVHRCLAKPFSVAAFGDAVKDLLEAPLPRPEEDEDGEVSSSTGADS